MTSDLVGALLRAAGQASFGKPSAIIRALPARRALG